MEKINVLKLDEFTQGYITAMLWIENDPDTGKPLDKNADLTLSQSALQKISEDCKVFQEKAGDLIAGRENDAGHDFWLTRRGHGCGFWETPDWPEADGEVLTNLAKEFGEHIHPFVNNDGLLYFM